MLLLLLTSRNFDGRLAEARQDVFLQQQRETGYTIPPFENGRTSSPMDPRCLTRDMLEHALQNYFMYGFPMDSLVPLLGRGENDAGGVFSTLIDSLDTLAITNHTETFHTSVRWIVENVKNFDQDTMVSVFETTIRILGGLLSAHLMMEEEVMPRTTLSNGKLYAGELLVLSMDLADRLLLAYNTPTGLPYGSINLRYGVPEGEVTEVSTACAGTNLLEMMMLTRLTGEPKYLAVAEKSAEALLYSRDGMTRLLGSHLDVATGEWSILHSSVGTGQDSTLEYLFKYHVLSGSVKWWKHFETMRVAALRYLRSGGLYVMANMKHPTESMTSEHDSLANFYPGLLIGAGRKGEGVEPLWTAHSIFRRFGAMPENSKRSYQLFLRGPQYPLRPEHVESLYYFFRATHDPAYRIMAEEFTMGLHLRTRTPRGFPGLRTVAFPHDNSMSYDVRSESFFISETLKYMYMLFEESAIDIGDTEEKQRLKAEVGGSSGVFEWGRRPDQKNQPSQATYSTSYGPSKKHPLHRPWIISTEAHLIPDSIIWWSRAQIKNEVPPLSIDPQLVKERVQNVDDLLSMLEARVVQQSEMVRRSKFRKRFWLYDVTNAGYYCENHPQYSLYRLSHSLYR